MAKEDSAFDDLDAEELGDYVPAVYARSPEQAERYRQLLEDHDVPAIIDEDYQPPEPHSGPGLRGALPVLVPESLLEEAKGYIADAEDMNDLIEDEDYLDEDEDEDEFEEEQFDLDEDDEQF